MTKKYTCELSTAWEEKKNMQTGPPRIPIEYDLDQEGEGSSSRLQVRKD